MVATVLPASYGNRTGCWLMTGRGTTQKKRGVTSCRTARTPRPPSPKACSYCLIKVLVLPAINIWVELPADGSYNGRLMVLAAACPIKLRANSKNVAADRGGRKRGGRGGVRGPHAHDLPRPLRPSTRDRVDSVRTSATQPRARIRRAKKNKRHPSSGGRVSSQALGSGGFGGYTQFVPSTQVA